MSDISISFPLWMVAWFLLGQALPFLTLATGGLIVAVVINRNSGRVRRLRWLTMTLTIVGSAWLAGLSFWATGILDEISSDMYQAERRYRLNKPTLFEGLEIPSRSWVSVDEEGRLYRIETDQQNPIS